MEGKRTYTQRGAFCGGGEHAGYCLFRRDEGSDAVRNELATRSGGEVICRDGDEAADGEEEEGED